MSTYRVHKNTNYSIINNNFLKRKDLSWKAKGILSYLLSLPDDWELHFNELKTNSTDGKTSTRTGLDELKEAGYIVYTKTRDKEGKFIHNYDIYENPQIKKSDTDNPDTENQDTDNRDILLRTNKLNTNQLNTNKTNKDIVEKEKIPFSDIVDYLNQRIGTKYRPSSKKTRRLIKARWNEGFRLDDFKTVIDKKAVEWIGDKQMEKYLRPPTLFGTKFESYLNQISVKNKGKSKAQRLQELYGELEDGEETDF